jgi:ABC-type polysaccharide/polyol phosphate export permease
MYTTVGPAVKDFTDAARAHRVWIYMAGNDIRLRYRGSTLGPIWITLTMVIFICTLSIVYSRLFHQQISEYVPFLTCGILVWTYISAVINESTDTFLAAKEYIEGMKMPYFVYIFRMIWRNLLVFFHNFVVYLLVALFFHVNINANTLLAVPCFLLVTADLAAASVIISLLGTRFRDLPPIINAMMTVVFFISPITWQSKLIGEQSLIVRLNPVSHLLNLVRDPLLGQLPPMEAIYVGFILLIGLWTIAFWVFSYHSKKIPFWL